MLLSRYHSSSTIDSFCLFLELVYKLDHTVYDIFLGEDRIWASFAQLFMLYVIANYFLLLHDIPRFGYPQDMLSSKICIYFCWDICTSAVAEPSMFNFSVCCQFFNL